MFEIQIIATGQLTPLYSVPRNWLHKEYKSTLLLFNQTNGGIYRQFPELNLLGSLLLNVNQSIYEKSHI